MKPKVPETLQKDQMRRALRWLPALAGIGVVAWVILPDLIAREPDAAERGPDHFDDLPWGGGTTASLQKPKPEPRLETRVAPKRRAAANTIDDDADDARDSSFDCIIEPSEVVQLGSAVTGVIKAIHVKRSERVEAGQVVAELESGVERAAVTLARARAQMDGRVKAREARLALGERRNTRVNELFQHETLSQDLRDQAETEAEIARLELKDAEETRRLASLELNQAMEILNRRSIRSPVSGVVVERLLAPGEVVDDEAILTIAQIDPLEVEVVLPAAYYGSIQSGARASVLPEFPGDRSHPASVEIVDQVIDAASGTFGVVLALPNPEGAIPAGLNCRVRFLED